VCFKIVCERRWGGVISAIVDFRRRKTVNSAIEGGRFLHNSAVAGKPVDHGDKNLSCINGSKGAVTKYCNSHNGRNVDNVKYCSGIDVTAVAVFTTSAVKAAVVFSDRTVWAVTAVRTFSVWFLLTTWRNRLKIMAECCGGNQNQRWQN